MGFCQCCPCQEAACWKAWTGASPTVPFGPSLLVCACVHVYLCDCLLVLWISVFVILDKGWLAGSWEGLSCWRFQIEPVSGSAQLLGTVTFLVEI